MNGDGKTVSVLVVEGTIPGFPVIRDEARDDAMACLAKLSASGVRTAGGRRKLSPTDLGSEARVELMPEDKRRIVRGMRGEGFMVAKVGDGFNDAPSLAVADIGIAMGGLTGVTLETADAAVHHSRIMSISDMIELSKVVMGNIRVTIAIALG